MPQSSSPPTMIGVDDAISIILGHVAPCRTSKLAVEDAHGRVLSSDLCARWSLPSSQLSVMDGYALRCADLDATDHLPLAGESAAGHPMTTPLVPATTIKISTGAVIPTGADLVVPREDTCEDIGKDDPVTPTPTVRFLDEARRQARPGRFIREIGSDVEAGELLLRAGTILQPGDLALAASAGHGDLPVTPAPRVAILCTGDELVAPGETPGPGQIVGTNGMMLAMQVREAGGIPVILKDVGDRKDALTGALDQLMTGEFPCDLLLTSGGISVGDHDLVYAELRARGLKTHFRKIRLRPGKPTTFGVLSRAGLPALPVLSLPGNPASTYVTFELLARPAIRKLAGLPEAAWQRRRRRLRLETAVEGNARRAHYVRAVVHGDIARPLPKQESGALRSISGHGALLIIAEGVVEAPEGSDVEAIILDPLTRSP